MKLLTIDTSTNVCSIALSDGPKLVAEYLFSPGKKAAARLVPAILELLADAGVPIAGLDGFGVALGPGSFTGIRVGLATVKGLALAAGKPAAGFSSLAMLAQNLPWAAHPVCSLFDARKGEVYAGIYRCRELPEPLVAVRAVPPAELVDGICEPTIFVGDGAVRYRAQIAERLGDLAIFAPESANVPRASAGAQLALAAFAHGDIPPLPLLNPVYHRLSEAEVSRLAAS